MIELNLEDKLACRVPGVDNEPFVRLVREKPYVKEQLQKLESEAVKMYLAECGAWSDSELEDHEMNLVRLVWLVAGGDTDRDYFLAFVRTQLPQVMDGKWHSYTSLAYRFCTDADTLRFIELGVYLKVFEETKPIDREIEGHKVRVKI